MLGNVIGRVSKRPQGWLV